MNPWTEEEEMPLVVCHKDASNDPEIQQLPREKGSNYPPKGFWARVYSDFIEHVGSNTIKTVQDLQLKWADLNIKYERWTTLYEQTVRDDPELDEDLAIGFTNYEYVARYGNDFDHVEAWRLLRQL